MTKTTNEIYDVIYGSTFKELLDNLEILTQEYGMPYKVLSFQETPDRFIAFIKLDKFSQSKEVKHDKNNY